MQSISALTITSSCDNFIWLLVDGLYAVAHQQSQPSQLNKAAWQVPDTMVDSLALQQQS